MMRARRTDADRLSVSLVRSPRIVTFVVYNSKIGAPALSLSLSLSFLSLSHSHPLLFYEPRRVNVYHFYRRSGVVGFKWRKPTCAPGP